MAPNDGAGTWEAKSDVLQVTPSTKTPAIPEQL